MIDINPDFAAVKQGLIPLTAQEQIKQEKDGLDVIHDLYRYAQMEGGFAAITDGDFERLKWYGVYRQKPKESGYFMLRTKVPGGQVNAAQARKLSELSERYARGFCDITTRQTIQMHWLKIEDFPTIFAELRDVGITTSGACGDDTRNVCGCPLAGVIKDEIIDATPVLREVSDALTDNRAFSNLPRKYKISISGCGIHCTQPDINCVGVFGLRRGDEAGYGIKVGGGLSAAPHMAQVLPVFLKPEQVWPVIEQVSVIFRDCGYRLKRSRARLKFLMADWGAERFLREIEDRLGYQLERHDDFQFPADQETDHLGVIEQKQPGMFAVGVCFAGGRIRNHALATCANLAEKYAAPGQDVIRFTTKQNLILLNIPAENLAALRAELAEAGLVDEPSNFRRRGCVSCTGIEFCNLAVAETKNRMMRLVEQLEATSGWYKGKIRIHFSGCPSSCGQHQIADIGFRGARTKLPSGVQVDAYDMFIGGRLGATRRFNELLKGKIIAEDVHLTIDKLLRFYDSRKQSPDESFAQVCDRVPKAEWLTALTA